MTRSIPFGKPLLGDEEKQAVMAVLEGSTLVHGPRAKAFEQGFAAYTGAPHALSLASCTAGMHLYWFERGIGPGDEVIVPAQTHVATAHAVEYTGAKTVFCDAESRTGNMDLDMLESLVTERTKGICVVHYLGLPVDMDQVNALAEKHGLWVLEDCALAIGSYLRGTHAGLLSDGGVFSFYPVKHMTTAEGGMFISRNGAVSKRIEKTRAFGVDRVVGTRKVPGVYDVTMLGYNYRMNELEAALGVEQLKRVPRFLEKRAENFSALQNALAGIDEIRVLETGSQGDKVSSHYCLSMVLSGCLPDKRPEMMAGLKEKGVGTSVYYPRPVPHMTYYKEKYGHGEDSFPNAAAISYGSIALPVGPHLDVADMAHIGEALKATIQEVSHS